MDFLISMLTEHRPPVLKTGFWILLSIIFWICFKILRFYRYQILIRKHLKFIHSGLIDEKNENSFSNKPNNFLEQSGINKNRNVHPRPQNLFFAFKMEFERLLLFDTDSHTEMNLKINHILFRSRLKNEFQYFFDRIKLFAVVSILIEACIIVSLFDLLADMSMIERLELDFSNVMQIFADAAYISGIPLIFILFLSIICYHSVNNGYYRLMNEIDSIVDVYRETKTKKG